MKITAKKDEVILEPQTGMDLFWLGVISSKNSTKTSWVDGEVKNLSMTTKDVIIGLGCKRD